MMYVAVDAGSTVDASVRLQIEAGSTATTYEPYTANTITPPLLPDGSPLHGNGTVDDTVENDVLSGCDKKIVLDGTNYAINVKVTTNGIVRLLMEVDDIGEPNVPIYSDKLNNGTWTGTMFSHLDRIATTTGHMGMTPTWAQTMSTVDEINAYLAANPLTVYYRSTDYTPEKDLRVCRVVRKWGKIDSYAGETITTEYISSTGGLDEGAQIVYKLSAPETYMTDPLPLRKPDTLTTDTVTVTGSGETAVEYAHDTKHYIDSKISELVTLALANQ